ncbi:MAG TPA: CoA transferase [Stenomitos sp.]
MGTAALTGLKVLDFTRALAGPFCTMMLGDLGAEVLKIEAPGKGDESRGWGPPFQGGESSYFLSCNRNKQSLTLNLKEAEAKSIALRLLQEADVLVENFSPGTMQRLGLDYAVAAEYNPRLIYCSISGFGQDGPNRSLPAYDLILQGMGGLMSITGPKQGPPSKVGVPIADLTAGMFAAHAILAALYHRERTGLGQYVDTSLLDGQLALLTFQAGRYFATGASPGLAGNEHPSIAPYETFVTRDGHLNVACGNDGLWRRFCTALGLEHLGEDPRFRTNSDRLAFRAELVARVEVALATLKTQEAIALLTEAGVPCGPIYRLEEVFEDQHVRELGLVQAIDHPTAGTVQFPGPPYRFSASPTELRQAPPRLGEHTDEVLARLGFVPAEVDALRQQGVL